MKPKNCLIFGASGQIGRNLIRGLTQKNLKVTAVTRNLHQKGYILKTQANPGYLELAEIKNFNGMNNLPKKEKGKKMSFKNEFQKEKILIREIDYYFSNAISRASKTMSDCRSIQKNKLLEGTNN